MNIDSIDIELTTYKVMGLTLESWDVLSS